MGCCEVSRQQSKSEIFIMDIILQMKISSLSWNEANDCLAAMSTMKDSINKKTLMSNIKILSHSRHYEMKVLENILSHLSETFNFQDINFYLIAFMNLGREDPHVLLFDLLFKHSKSATFTYSALEKSLFDYLSFYTIKLNFCIESNLKQEHKAIIYDDLIKLNLNIYTYDHIRHIVKQIVKDSKEKDVVTLESFRIMLMDYKIFEFSQIRDIFTNFFEVI